MVALLAGAALQPQEAVSRFHGFATVNGEWVVVDGTTGESCRLKVPGLTSEDRVATAREYAGIAGETVILRMHLNQADCRDPW
jgi:hypothetical protein